MSSYGRERSVHLSNTPLVTTSHRSTRRATNSSVIPCWFPYSVAAPVPGAFDTRRSLRVPARTPCTPPMQSLERIPTPSRSLTAPPLRNLCHVLRVSKISTHELVQPPNDQQRMLRKCLHAQMHRLKGLTSKRQQPLSNLSETLVRGHKINIRWAVGSGAVQPNIKRRTGTGSGDGRSSKV